MLSATPLVSALEVVTEFDWLEVTACEMVVESMTDALWLTESEVPLVAERETEELSEEDTPASPERLAPNTPGIPTDRLPETEFVLPSV